jgi:hypothetical protein
MDPAFWIEIRENAGFGKHGGHEIFAIEVAAQDLLMKFSAGSLFPVAALARPEISRKTRPATVVFLPS